MNPSEESYSKAIPYTKGYKEANKVTGFNDFRNRIDILEGRDEEKSIQGYLGDLRAFVEILSGVVNEDTAKDVKKSVIGMVEELTKTSRELKSDTNDYKKVSESINNDLKLVDKNIAKMPKIVQEAYEQLKKDNKKVIEASGKISKDLVANYETLNQAINDSIKGIGQGLMKFSNFLNLGKLVAPGGMSIESLRDMQHNTKIELGLDTTRFLDTQRSLVSQNLEGMNLTYKDTVNYLSSIKEYSLRNVNQATQLYKQVSVGTKYLGLTSSNIQSLTKAVNQLNDNNYMSQQMAILATLKGDSALSGDIGSIADYIGANSSKVASRYNNWNQMLTDASVLKYTSDALFGSDSELVNNLMAEIMGKSDFSQLSESTQRLLSWTGQASTVWGQMRSGNVDFASIIQGVLSNTSNLQKYDKITLEQLGLGDWITTGGTYQRNQQEWTKYLSYYQSKLDGIDFSNKEQADAALQSIANQNDDRTFFEKAEDTLFNTLGIQNKNWSAVLGILQTISLVGQGIALYSSITQNTKLSAILAAILGKSATESITGSGKYTNILGKGFGGNGLLGKAGAWLGSKSMGASLGGSTFGGAGALTNGAALGLGALGIGAGLVMGFRDASKMSYGEGLDWGDARGFFLGTGSSGKSTGENAVSVLGNTAKYAAIGAGIGTIIPGIGTAIGAGVGALAGLVTGLIGTSMDDNTEAVKSNTKVIKDTNNSLSRNSALANYIRNDEGTGGTNGFGVGGSSSGGYPWGITSGFGWRTKIKDGKEVKGEKQFHYGVDFGVRRGTPIGAAMSGKVSHAGWYGGGGNTTIIKGDDGWNYKYMHQIKTPPVSKGQRVSIGDTIGWVGSTGNSTGAHLHFQVDKGSNRNAVNPIPYITGGLFSASGKTWNPPKTGDVNNATENDISTSEAPSLIYSLAKEAVFSAAGGANDESTPLTVDSPQSGFATSADIDRLIDTIQNLKNEQDENRQFMQALASKNKFVFSGN